MITYNIDLFIGRNKPEQKAVVKCHDTGVCLRVSFKTERKTSKWRTTEEPYTIPAGTTAVLKIEKPDKKRVLQDGELQGSGVFFKLPLQSFTAAGMASAEVNLFDLDGRRITSETFYIEVPQEVADDCAVDSENYVSLMAEQIQAAVDAAKRAEASAKRAEEAGADIPPEDIQKAVEEYMAEHPPQVEIPAALPNPQALRFTGAVDATYDGSEALEVVIPAAVTDAHINSLINTALGVIENGTY